MVHKQLPATALKTDIFSPDDQTAAVMQRRGGVSGSTIRRADARWKLIYIYLFRFIYLSCQLFIFHGGTQEVGGGALTYLWDTDPLTGIQEVLHIPTAFSHAELWLEGSRAEQWAIHIMSSHCVGIWTHIFCFKIQGAHHCRRGHVDAGHRSGRNVIG